MSNILKFSAVIALLAIVGIIYILTRPNLTSFAN